MMTCEFALDDGAYVLGALTPAERADFERHLASCPSCRENVANLAVLPGLLGRLDPGRAVALTSGTAHEPAPPTLLPRVLAAAAQRRRFDRRRSRRRRTALTAALSLTVIALVAAVGVTVHLQDSRPTPPVAMSAMRPASQTWTPVSADIGVAPTDGGSKILLTCWYSTASGDDDRWTMRIVVFERGSVTGESLGTWTASGGQTIRLTGVTHLQPSEIGRVELQRFDSTPLLWWTPV
jgi:hypothetical protein